MNVHQHAEKLLQKIAHELPLDQAARAGLVLDGNRECFLTLEPGLLVMFYLDEASQAFIINLPLGALPPPPLRETLMFELLCGNYSWNQTEGGTLGIDRQTEIVTLSYLVEIPMAEPDQFPRIIEKLAGVAKHWKRIKQRIGSEAATDGRFAAAPGQDSHRIRV
jgi:hypothetical protein